MKLTGLFIAIWVMLRLVFHSFSFENSAVAAFVYFASQDFALITFFYLLYLFVDGNRFRFKYISVPKLKRLIICLIVYASWCFVVDILLLLNIGAADFIGYTVISFFILSLSILWTFI